MSHYYSEVQGDLLATNSPVIAHGCNAKGFMGAGVAKLIKQKHPDIVKSYEELCISGGFQLGHAQLSYSSIKNQIIANLCTQHSLGCDARLNAIEIALDNLGIQLNKLDIDEVAMPRIGCGIGGLEWEDVEPVVERFAEKYRIKTTVYVL